MKKRTARKVMLAREKSMLWAKLLSPSMSTMVFSMRENTRALSERAQKNSRCLLLTVVASRNEK